MKLERYVEDLDGFVKASLADFMTKCYLPDPDNCPGHILERFMAEALEQVTLRVKEAHISKGRYGVLRVKMEMGGDTFETQLSIGEEIIKNYSQ